MRFARQKGKEPSFILSATRNGRFGSCFVLYEMHRLAFAFLCSTAAVIGGRREDVTAALPECTAERRNAEIQSRSLS